MIQLCQAGGEDAHSRREAVGFIRGANWCQFHYDRIEKMLEETREHLAANYSRDNMADQR
jgi:hypothetical protein